MPGFNDVDAPQSNGEGAASPPQSDAKMPFIPAIATAAALALSTVASSTNDLTTPAPLVSRKAAFSPAGAELPHDNHLFSKFFQHLSDCRVQPSFFLEATTNTIKQQTALEPSPYDAFVLSLSAPHFQGTSKNLPAFFTQQQSMNVVSDNMAGQIGYQLDVSVEKGKRFDAGKVQVSSLFFENEEGRIQVNISPAITIIGFDSTTRKSKDTGLTERYFGVSSTQGFHIFNNTPLLCLSGPLQRKKYKLSLSCQGKDGTAIKGNDNEADKFCDLICQTLQTGLQKTLNLQDHSTIVPARCYSYGQIGSDDDHDYAREMEINTALGNYSTGMILQCDTAPSKRDTDYINRMILKL